MKRNLVTLTIVGTVLVAILVIANGVLAPKQPADVTAVNAANRLVESGQYPEAIQIYQQLLAQGVLDSTVYYNLGNAYYRLGDLGRATINYQRAAQLAPRDGDIKANLSLVQSQVQNPLVSEAPGPLAGLAKVTGGWLTLNETALLALGSWFLIGLLFLALRQSHPGRLRTGIQYLTALVLLILLLTGLSLGSRLYLERFQPDGVVVAPVVAVSSEPGEQFATQISLSSGTQVNLVESRGGWVRLVMPGDDLQGWVPLDAIETVADAPLTHGALL